MASERELIRKRRRLAPRGSSSSGRTAVSKAPKDILALGGHLVHELGLSESTDTLGRWMAHYIAELIAHSTSQKNGADRLRIDKQVETAILRVWEHRAVLPRGTYPLAPYKKLATFVESMQQEQLYPMQATKLERATTKLFRLVPRLVVALTLVGERRFPPPPPGVAVGAMTSHERARIGALHAWVNLLRTASPLKKGRAVGKKGRSSRETLDFVPHALAREYIDQCQQALDEARTFLDKLEGSEHQNG
jgi:hypothetical protein